MQSDIMTDLEFENQIKDFTPEARFLARQIKSIEGTCAVENKRLCVLENRDRRTFAVVGGGAGTLGAFVGGFVMFLIKNWKP